MTEKREKTWLIGGANDMEATFWMEVNYGYATTQDVSGTASLHIEVDFMCKLYCD